MGSAISQESRASVAVIDDHPVVQQAMAALLSLQPDLAFAGAAGDGESGLQLIDRHRPQALLIDLCLPAASGFDLIPIIRDRWPDVVIVVYSSLDDPCSIRRCFHLGARGYVIKTCQPDEIFVALRRALRGQHATPPRPLSPPPLTSRESEILDLIGRGMSTTQVARALRINVKSVESYRRRIKARLGLVANQDFLAVAEQHANSKRVNSPDARPAAVDCP